MSEYGARIVSVKTLDRYGKSAEITLAYANHEQYLNDEVYLGASVGPIANRVAHAQFNIAGAQYNVDKNEGEHHLHSGATGLHQAIWQRIDDGKNDDYIELLCKRVAGLGNYPGNVEVRVTLRLTASQQMIIHYKAVTDAATPISITNHCYWNLSGGLDQGYSQDGTVLDHHLQLNAEQYLELGQYSIPTGKALLLNDGEFGLQGAALTDLSAMPDNWKGIDHYFIRKQTSEELSAEAGKQLGFAAKLLHPKSGRSLSLYTNAPGLQCYTGQWLQDKSLQLSKESGLFLKPFAGLCLEPHGYPDSLSHTHFPSIILSPERQYSNILSYQFDVF